MKALLLIPFLFLSINGQSQPNVKDLEGIWKIEGKDNYEAWQMTGEGNLVGKSYKISDGIQIVSETLLIKSTEGTTIYEATVPDQNDGKTVPFTLNSEVKNALSFENPEHDFPTKIIYQFETKNRLFVQVQGADGKGFSFYMDK
ncbi:MAG TPA: DUF6265 family protein [Fulvivirga sp.]|nr:DUF6265 family protein [Fulvivirga sp.]